MTFSITIPAYKSPYLKEAIESVISQSYADWELIIVDDCSPENLKQIVEPYLQDKRIYYYRNEKNCGAVNVVDNWNICLSYCSGEYVICMGDDDRLLPTCLEKYKEIIDKYPTLNVYHTRTEIIDNTGKIINLQEQRPEWESVLSIIWNRWDHRGHQYIGDFCYRTSYLKDVGGYYKQPLAWGSDDITAVKAACSNGIANTIEYGFQYRENPNTITNTSVYAEIKMATTLKQYKWYNDFIKGLSTNNLSQNDRLYLDTISRPQREYFLLSLGKNCVDGTKGNPVKMFRYYRLLRSMHFSLSTYAKWYIASVYHKFS